MRAWHIKINIIGKNLLFAFLLNPGTRLVRYYSVVPILDIGYIFPFFHFLLIIVKMCTVIMSGFLLNNQNFSQYLLVKLCHNHNLSYITVQNKYVYACKCH
jgi:hypothetical protein